MGGLRGVGGILGETEGQAGREGLRVTAGTCDCISRPGRSGALRHRIALRLSAYLSRRHAGLFFEYFVKIVNVMKACLPCHFFHRVKICFQKLSCPFGAYAVQVGEDGLACPFAELPV